jgi:hypothetical protein
VRVSGSSGAAAASAAKRRGREGAAQRLQAPSAAGSPRERPRHELEQLGEQARRHERHVDRHDDDRALAGPAQRVEDPVARVEALLRLAPDLDVLERRQRRVGLGDDDGLHDHGTQRVERPVHERPARQRDGRLGAAQPRATPAGEHDAQRRGAHTLRGPSP